MDLKEFLTTVITGESGFFCLGIKPAGEPSWWEEWYNWPADIDNIVTRAHHLKEDNNIYFSSYLFSAQKSTKEHVLASRTIQADLDDADINNLPITPSILVESSPGRHQGYWILSSELEPDQHEILSRKLTYSIPLCDHSGWALGRKVRLPETLNHKYLEGPQPVKIVSITKTRPDPSTIELLQDINIETAAKEEEWLSNLPTTFSISALELLESIKPSIPLRIYIQYSTKAKDRSRAIWALMCSAFRAGLNRNQVYWLAKHSENNKFSTLRHNGDKELGKDVLRAEQVTKTQVIDVKTAILEARKLTQASATEKRQIILELVLAHMKMLGMFIRTSDDNIWYIRKDLGRPIIITPRSEYLAMILDLQFGLNAIEIEQGYVVQGLSSYTRSLHATAITGSLSHYDPDTDTVLIHTGKKDVIRITKSNIERAINGSYGIVFPWISSNQEFEPKLHTKINWAEILFENVFDNVIGLDKEEAEALIKVWFLFLIFRNGCASRPILALFGQPGSGKSTLGRRIYRVIYGSHRSISTVTNQEDFDHAVSVDPLCILDNVDTWAAWLPDRIAQSASTSDIVKRKLYTDVDTITLKRQALIGITAHNPKFGREDVADRLILFNFQRLSKFIPEQDILEKISVYRNDIWGSIIQDIQAILNTSTISKQPYPQFRIEDFAKTGWRIARAINVPDAFASGLKKVSVGQKLFTLEEEHLLVTALQRLVTLQKTASFKSATAIWTELESCSPDPTNFQRSYKSAVFLSKKLWAMQEPLKELFDIRWKFNSQLGTRLWLIGDKSDNGRESHSTNNG